MLCSLAAVRHGNYRTETVARVRDMEAERSDGHDVFLLSGKGGHRSDRTQQRQERRTPSRSFLQSGRCNRDLEGDFGGQGSNDLGEDWWGSDPRRPDYGRGTVLMSSYAIRATMGAGGSMKNRVAWALAVVLAGVVLGGSGLLFVRVRPSLVARYRGHAAELLDAQLPGASLAGVDLGEALLFGADLRGAHLAGADLRRASLAGADLRNANLQGADLRDAFMLGGHVVRVHRGPGKSTLKLKPKPTDLRGADLRGANLQGAQMSMKDSRIPCIFLSGARYDARTRWPKGFDPTRLGAVKVR
jgi:hypothetical protein